LFITFKEIDMTVKYSGPIKRVATAITQSTRNKLEKHLWCIFTDDEMTQNAVMEYLSTIQLADMARIQIMYSGKSIPVISLPFKVVMFLKNNKARSNYKYTPYHRETNRVSWAVWKEGTKTPPQSLRNNDHLFKRVPF
jgi:hypothetical protein